MHAYESNNSHEFVDFDSFVNFQADEIDISPKDAATGASYELQNSMDGCLSYVDPTQLDLSFQDTALTQSTSPDSSFMSSAFTSPQTSLLDYSNAPWSTPEIADADLTACDPFFDDATQWLPHVTSTIKELAHARAHTDKSSTPMKVKRRDAAISLYLQRQHESDMQMAASLSQRSFDDFISGVESISSSQSPQSSHESVPGLSASTSTNSPASTDAPATSSQPATGGFEIVLDLNMNATTRIPRKQKPRTKEQIEDYINVRRNGACIKHKKQHKKVGEQTMFHVFTQEHC
jgi:hypothetical protein